MTLWKLKCNKNKNSMEKSAVVKNKAQSRCATFQVKCDSLFQCGLLSHQFYLIQVKVESEMLHVIKVLC